MKILSMICLVALFQGCAQVKHLPIASEKEDATDSGIRYYRSAPYLLIYFNATGDREWKIMNLPDVTTKMSAQPSNVLSKVKADLTFVNGVLSDSKEEADDTALGKAVLEAIEKIVPLLAATPNAKTEVTAPVIYKIIVKGDAAWLKGDKLIPLF